jgi:four helix bundle protein
MAENDMPIFTRTFVFLTWLLPLTNHFPKAQRFTVTSRLLQAAFELREDLESAQHRRGSERIRALSAADENLAKVRLYLRLSHQWSWISLGQYEHAARMLAEIGRLLGGWQKVTKGG